MSNKSPFEAISTTSNEEIVHADYSVLDVEQTPDIELNNTSITKNSESTVSEEESTVATEIL